MLLLVFAAERSTLAAPEAEAAKGTPEAFEAPEQIEDLDISKLLKVVVTATKEEQTVAEAPSIVSVIDRADFARYNYRTVAEALGSLPGVYVNNDYVFHDVGLRGISGELRGRSRLVKVAIDGQPVSFRPDSGNLLDHEMMPLEAIARIEVIRGPVSALYGANAFLGMINVIPRKGKDLMGASVSFSGSLFDGSQKGVTFGLVTGTEVGPLDILFAVSRSYLKRDGRRIRCTTHTGDEEPCENVSNITRALLDRESFDDVAQPTSFFGAATVDLSKLFGAKRKLGKIELMGNLQMLDSRGSFSDWGTLNYVRLADSQGELQRLVEGNRVALANGTFRGRYSLSTLDERLRVQVGAAYAGGGSTDAEHLRGATRVIARDPFNYKSVDGFGEVYVRLLKDRFAFGATTPGADGEPVRKKLINELGLRLGADATGDWVTLVNDAGATPLGFKQHRLRNIGVWGQLTGRLIDDRVGLVAGLRYDDHRGGKASARALGALDADARDRLCDDRVCYDQLSFRVGTTFSLLKRALAVGKAGHLIEGLHAKVLFGTAFKAPSPTFLYNEGYLSERPLNPNPGLLPQEVSSFEAMVGLAMLKQRIDLSATLFYNDLSNRAEFTRRGLAVVAENGASIETWGIEGTLRVAFKPFTGYGTVSYQNSARQLGDNPSDRIEETFGYPDLMATAGVSYLLKVAKLMASVELQYVGTRVGSPFNRSDRQEEKYELDPYALLNVNLATRGFKPFGKKETRVALSVKNLLGTTYDYPGYQPYYRYDVPGLPRTIWLVVGQDF